MNVFLSYLCCAVLCFPALLCWSEGTQHDVTGGQVISHDRHKRAAPPSLNDRTKCGPDDQWPVTRVNTTQRLQAMRAAMTSSRVQAFIVLSDDAHNSEYPAKHDLRRGFISGFSGSAGWAVVTMTKAALWTDGRYFLEAEDALDCNWIFMKDGEPGVPSYTAWLISELTTGEAVGADPFLVTNSEWQTTQRELSAAGINLTAVSDPSPVDTAWTDQPPPPNTTINALDIEYSGRSWQDKVRDVHKAMEDKGVTGATVVTSLDEVAWLFNVRASDISYVPVFIGYAVVEYYGASSSSNNRIRLYIYDKDTRLTVAPSDPETTDRLHEHLNTGQNGSCDGKTGMCVEVLEYNPAQVVADIRSLTQASGNKIWVTFLCNFAIFDAIPQAQRVQARSYIALAKSQKNPTERRGMRTCYNRDSAVVVEFLAMMEKEIGEGKKWTEVSAAAELKKRREAADKNRGLSFNTIAGSGPNGAVIHYRPAPETDRQLTTQEMFLLDSGGQYLDCTTDVTRTMHYGTPSAFMKECYTRVLMGSIDLATLVWPEGLYGREIDAVARAPLWSVGLEYNHGTGHGIGHYLSVHEGPGRISLVHTVTKSYETLHPYMFFSDEPGYYQPGEFGIRLETIVMVDPVNTTHGDRYGQKQFLAMKPFTMVPFEPKLIDHTMLSAKQIAWLNSYHKQTQETLEPLLTTDTAREWLRERTKPYVTPTSTASSPPPLSTLTLVILGIAGVALTLTG